jgi:branched-chain amino acid transport system permease protein
LSIFAQQIVNGLTLGSLYALVAAGLALIFGVVGLVNFAHGELFMVGGFALYELVSVEHLNFFLAAALTVVILAVFGAVVHEVALRRLIDKGWHVQLVATLAISILLQNIALRIWGATPKAVFTSYSFNTVVIGSVRFAQQRIIVLAVAIGAFVLLHFFIRYTKYGKAMRAVSQNRSACEVVGISIRRISLITFSIGAALSGAAAAAVGPLYDVSPTMGTLLTLKAFAVVIMGGFGNVVGAIYAAFVLGIAESLTSAYVSSAYADAVAFGAMILVLLLRPQGLFGQRAAI